LRIKLGKIDHRLSTVAAFAMDVLEQVQRQRARAVEQQNIALLQIEEVALGNLRDQRRHRLARRFRQKTLACEHPGKFGRGGLQFRCRIR
jgi:hypothetical protein